MSATALLRPPPTVFEHMEVTALRTPGRLAVREGTTDWSYAQCYALTIGLTRALDRLGVRQGQRVALSRPGFMLQLLLLVACENVGAVSACFQGEDDRDAPALFGMVDWVLSELPQECPAGVRFQRLDQAFFDAALAMPWDDPAPYPRLSVPLDAPSRIARTSGSTGNSKFMLLTRRAQENFMQAAGSPVGYGQDSRVVIASPLVLNAAYLRACACLRSGAAAMAVRGADIQAAAPTHIWALPMRLEELIGEMPAGVRLTGVTVHTSGGALPPALAEQATRLFGGPLVNGYGANEAGVIVEVLDKEGTGLIRAGVDVRVLDAQGRDLPPGGMGVLAVRTPSMAAGYLDAPEETAQSFRDGWFHSGDLGMLAAPRVLRLMGRHDDLVNIGGIKQPAAQVEAQVRALVRVDACAVATVRLHGSDTTVGIALVAPPGADQGQIRQALQESLQLGALTVVRIVFLERLPMLQGGKLDRMALQRAFEDNA